MHALHQLFYLQEIQAQCRMARQASDALNQWLAKSEPMFSIEQGAMQTAELFRNVHSMLTHTANISRLLWPGNRAKPIQKQRAEVLRALLELPADGHHLLGKRTLRDHLEHFDERLDEWTARGDGPPDYWQDHVGPWEVTQQYGAKKRNVMRHFDLHTRTFRFQGNPLDIALMIGAVQVLQHCVNVEVDGLIQLLYPQPDLSMPSEWKRPE